MEVVFIVLCVFIGLLTFREQKLPRWAVDQLLVKVSSGDWLAVCDDISVSLRRGVRIGNPRLFNLGGKRHPNAFVSARSVAVAPWSREVVIDELRFPFLHDGYYEVGEVRERNAPLEAEFPEVPTFKLTLTNPQVLGIVAEEVNCRVCVSERELRFDGIRLVWPEAGEEMALNGCCRIDLDEQMVKGEVRGHAHQRHIRPLLTALDVPSAYPYIDAFTEVTEPVPACCGWNVNLVNNDFRLDLDLKPTMGRYNGVPMSRVDGKIGLYVYTRGTNMNFRTQIGPLKVWDNSGALMLDGQVTVVSTNDECNVEFDARGHALPRELTTIIDYLNGGALDVYETKSPIDVSVGGKLATDIARQGENDLRGHLESSACGFLGIPFAGASVDYAYVGDTVVFTNLSATGMGGGKLLGGAKLKLPGLDETRDSFELDLRYVDGTMAELADALGVKPEDRHGKVDGWIRMSAPLSEGVWTNAVATGHINIKEGMVWRMKFFDPLRKALGIEKLQVVDAVTGLCDGAKADFSLANGIVTVKNLVVEGPILSVTAEGTYDLANDRLDLLVCMHPVRKSASAGMIQIGEFVHLLTWPLTKPVDMRVTGPLSDPKWNSRWMKGIRDIMDGMRSGK